MGKMLDMYDNVCLWDVNLEDGIIRHQQKYLNETLIEVDPSLITIESEHESRASIMHIN